MTRRLLLQAVPSVRNRESISVADSADVLGPQAPPHPWYQSNMTFFSITISVYRTLNWGQKNIVHPTKISDAKCYATTYRCMSLPGTESLWQLGLDDSCVVVILFHYIIHAQASVPITPRPSPVVSSRVPFLHESLTVLHLPCVRLPPPNGSGRRTCSMWGTGDPHCVSGQCCAAGTSGRCPQWPGDAGAGHLCPSACANTGSFPSEESPGHMFRLPIVCSETGRHHAPGVCRAAHDSDEGEKQHQMVLIIRKSGHIRAVKRCHEDVTTLSCGHWHPPEIML